jgi:hypothetical protein
MKCASTINPSILGSIYRELKSSRRKLEVPTSVGVTSVTEPSEVGTPKNNL